MMHVWRLTDVCLTVTYIGLKSRTERPRKTKISIQVAQVTCGSDTTFKVKRSTVNLQAAWAYCGGLQHSLFISTLTGQLLKWHTIWQENDPCDEQRADSDMYLFTLLCRQLACRKVLIAIMLVVMICLEISTCYTLHSSSQHHHLLIFCSSKIHYGLFVILVPAQSGCAQIQAT